MLHSTLIVVFVVTSAVLVLPCSNASEPAAVALEQRFEVIADDGRDVGTAIVSRAYDTHQVEAVCFAGPTSAIEVQKKPWSRWHEFPELTEVNLVLAKIEPGFWRYAATLGKLKKMTIEDCIFEPNALLDGADLENLEELDVTLTSDGLQDWRFLGKLPALRVLRVYGCPVAPEFGDQLRTLKTLRQLECIVDDASAAKLFAHLIDLPPNVSIKIIRQAGGRPRPEGADPVHKAKRTGIIVDDRPRGP